MSQRTKEIDVWFNDLAGAVLTRQPTRDEMAQNQWRKAKLVMPVEPEVVECELSWSRHGEALIIDKNSNYQRAHEKLKGRRWSIVATEILETP